MSERVFLLPNDRTTRGYTLPPLTVSLDFSSCCCCCWFPSRLVSANPIVDFFFVTFFLVYTYIFAFFVEVAFFSRFSTFSTVSFKFVLFFDFVLFHSFLSLFFIFSFLVEVECEASSHQVPAELSATHQFSSAHQRSAVRYRALPCDAVLCGVLPCCALCYTSKYLLFRTRQVSFEVSYQVPCTWSRFVRTTLIVESQKMHCHPAQLSYNNIAQQRSATQRRAVVRCPAVLRRCAFFFVHTIPARYHAQQYQILGAGMYV